MKNERRETIRKRLLHLREEVLGEFRTRNAEAASLIDEGVPDLADQGLTNDLKEVLHLLSDSKREEIMKIDEALERLAEGGYGLCVDCGGAIGTARLEVRPYTRFCISCKEALEKEETLKAGPGAGLL